MIRFLAALADEFRFIRTYRETKRERQQLPRLSNAHLDRIVREALDEIRLTRLVMEAELAALDFMADETPEPARRQATVH